MLRRARAGSSRSGSQSLQDEALRSLDPAVEEQRADQRLDDVADDIVALARAVLARLLAEPDQRRNADLAADSRRRSRGRPSHCSGLRQIAFGLVRIALVERAGDDHSEHAVAEEFEPLVAVAADARMGERELEQAEVLRLVARALADEGCDVAAHSASPV